MIKGWAFAHPKTFYNEGGFVVSGDGGVVVDGGVVGGGVVAFGFDGDVEFGFVVEPGVPGILPLGEFGFVVFGLVAPGVVVFGVTLVSGVVFGFTVEGDVLVPGAWPELGVVLAGGVAVCPGGVAVLPGGVAVPGAGVAVPGVCACPAAPEPPAGAVPPPAGALCAKTQVADSKSKETKANFVNDIDMKDLLLPIG